MNLYQYAKNQAFSSFSSRDIVNLKMLQSDWLRAFWGISQKPKFSQAWDLCKNTANIKLLYRPNSEKITDSHSQLIQKALFLAHFPHFWGKKRFLGKSGSHIQLHMGF